MNLKTFLAAVRMYWKAFTVVTLTVLAAGLAWLVLTPSQYVSSTQLLVSIQGSTTAAAYQNDEVVAGRVNSYIELLTSDVVTQRVIDKLGLPMTAPELGAKISATNVPPNTSIIDVAVTADSPERARQLADTLSQEFISYTDALETPTGLDGQKVQTIVVTGASEPRSRLIERVALGVLVALAALLLGAVAVWIRSVSDGIVRTASRAAAAAGVPALGSVSSEAVASFGDLEGYRHLRTRLRSMRSGRDGGVLELAPVDSSVDATVVATNLGRAMALAGTRSIVVDADFADSPQQHRDTVPSTQEAGSLPEILSTSVWAAHRDQPATEAAFELVRRLRREYEYVIVATPAMASAFTASAVSDNVDDVILLVSVGRTKRRDLTRAAESLRATGATLTGVVVVEETTPADVVASKAADRGDDQISGGGSLA